LKTFTLALAVVLALAIPQTAAAEDARAVRTLSVTADMTIATYQYNGNTDPDQTLDAYYHPGVSGRPWIITLHGGSWAAGSKANADMASRKFQAEGFQVFNVAYRLTSDYGDNTGVPFTAQRDDIVAAYQWIRSNAGQFGINPDRGAIYGFSAGGHLAMSVGTYLGKPALKAIVSASGVLQPHRVQDVADSDPDTGHGGDLPTVGNKTLARWAAVAMRCPRLTTWTDCNNRWLDFMPETHLDANTPPMMTFQGTADESVPSQTGRSFKYWTDRAGIRNTLVEGVNWGHTELLAFDGGTRQTNMITFLKAETA
jgi:acetyl esterase/lipase